ncbi:MAG: NUDIX hydrolase [Candidatus Aenigmarchaeota archaeon]|nr:NUDIX hydrolase [Candidatus Aenigmarchaeota archaeon]
MQTRVFTAGIIRYEDKILILKRRDIAEPSPGKWDSIGGSIKEEETAEECILREGKEETGLDIKIIKKGKVFEFKNEHGNWVVIPFLCEANSTKVKVNPREHMEYKWIHPSEIDNYDCVPDLKKDLKILGLI